MMEWKNVFFFVKSSEQYKQSLFQARQSFHNMLQTYSASESELASLEPRNTDEQCWRCIRITS